MKNLIVLALAVVIGIWVYRKVTNGTGKRAGGPLGDGRFEGPDVDPTTGAHLPLSAQPATVEFSAQGN
jgi:hypothetical protein